MRHVETESQTEDRLLVCPLCGSDAFNTYRGRVNARCAGCGSKERGRFLGLVLKRLAPAPSGAPVYHFAPEKKIADLLHRQYGAAYVPADIEPELYGWSQVPVRRVDLCRSADDIQGPVQGMVHSHVLEHIPASIERVIREMNALIEPGGFHIFQVPVQPGWYREDMDPDLPGSERKRMFFQENHMRSFGQRDFAYRVLDLFEGFERVEIAAHVSAKDLAAAAVRPGALRNPTGHSVFFFRKRA
jgi:hypothetical protein